MGVVEHSLAMLYCCCFTSSTLLGSTAVILRWHGSVFTPWLSQPLALPDHSHFCPVYQHILVRLWDLPSASPLPFVPVPTTRSPLPGRKPRGLWAPFASPWCSHWSTAPGLTLCEQLWWLYYSSLCSMAFSNFASIIFLFSAVTNLCCIAVIKLKMISRSFWKEFRVDHMTKPDALPW